MSTTVDGEYQRYKAEDGAYVRDHFFGKDPRTKELVADMSDDELWNLRRGGLDYRKIYAAYKVATELDNGKPTVILAKTIKGWTLGPDVEGRNATHQIKELTNKQLLELRKTLHLEDEIPDEALEGESHPPVLPTRSGHARARVPHGPTPGARWPAPAPRRCRRLSLHASWRRGLRRGQRRLGQGRSVDHLRIHPPHPIAGADARDSGPTWCRSSPTRPAPSGWTRCSAS